MTSNFLIFTSKNQGGLVRPAAVPLSPIPRGPRPHRKNNAVFQPCFPFAPAFILTVEIFFGLISMFKQAYVNV